MKIRSLLFLCIVFFPWPASAMGSSAEPAPVTLDQLVSGHSVDIRSKYEISRLEVASVNATDLFSLGVRRSSSWFPGRTSVATLKLRNKDSLTRLRSLLAQQEAPQLILVLEDESWVAALHRALREEGIPVVTAAFGDRVVIPIDMTPCEKVTNVIYRNIDEIVGRMVRRAGQTGESVTLDQVFDLLLAEKVEPFIDHLGRPEMERHPCSKTFSLLNWLRRKEVKGFEFAEYRITNDLKEILGRVADSLRGILTWQRHQLRISVTGFTDDVRFGDGKQQKKKLFLLSKMTGIRQLNDPLHVRYAGCSKDRLDQPKSIDVSFSANSGNEVGSTVDNNCELGAVRAYVALAFLRQALGTAEREEEYQYATGGISPVAPKGKEDALTRKVEIQFRVKAAKELRE